MKKTKYIKTLIALGIFSLLSHIFVYLFVPSSSIENILSVSLSFLAFFSFVGFVLTLGYVQKEEIGGEEEKEKEEEKREEEKEKKIVFKIKKKIKKEN